MQDQQRYWYHNSNMVHIMGIQVKLLFVVKPQCGFHVQMIVFQTPLHMSQMLGGNQRFAVGDVGGNNMPVSPNDESHQGHFKVNNKVMSALVIDKEGVHLCFLREKYNQLFQKQIKDNSDMSFHDEMSSMKC